MHPMIVINHFVVHSVIFVINSLYFIMLEFNLSFLFLIY